MTTDKQKELAELQKQTSEIRVRESQLKKEIRDEKMETLFKGRLAIPEKEFNEEMDVSMRRSRDVRGYYRLEIITDFYGKRWIARKANLPFLVFREAK